MNKKRILIVDDEVSFTRLVKLNLEQAGDYEVRTESSGALAVSAAMAFKPDLILLDNIMPDLDGGDVIARLKSNASLKDIPVVFLTATVRKQEVDARGGVIGGFPFVAKPVTVSALVVCIEENLKNRQVRSEK